MLLRPVSLLWSLKLLIKDNALTPMRVTGKPSMVPGMTTFPTGASITSDRDRAVGVRVAKILGLQFAGQYQGSHGASGF